MTPVGHSLTGVALAFVALRTASSPTTRRISSTVAAFVLLANLPDLPFPNWGHDRYDISHSLLVIGPLAVAAAAIFLSSQKLTQSVGGRRVVLVGAAACLSHLLLDTFYNHGQGLAMFWPLSGHRVALPIPWFETIKPPMVSVQNLKIYAIEFASYAPFVAAAAYRFRKQSGDALAPG